MSRRAVETWIDICKRLDEREQHCFRDWGDLWKRLGKEDEQKVEGNQ